MKRPVVRVESVPLGFDGGVTYGWRAWASTSSVDNNRAIVTHATREEAEAAAVRQRLNSLACGV